MNIIYIFIDASNVWNAVKSVKKFIEYKTLKDYFRKNFNADKVEIFYYDAYQIKKPPSIKRATLGCITITVL